MKSAIAEILPGFCGLGGCDDSWKRLEVRATRSPVLRVKWKFEIDDYNYLLGDLYRYIIDVSMHLKSLSNELQTFKYLEMQNNSIGNGRGIHVQSI